MPPNDRTPSSHQHSPTDLERRYGKIGISAVEAAARYSTDRKSVRRSVKDAGGDAANKERWKPPKE
jgi:hypothetical protein